MFKPQTKDKRLIDELRQKNSELEELVVRLESELIRIGKRLDFEYQRGFSYGHNEGTNKYLEILSRQEQLKSTRVLVMLDNPELHEKLRKEWGKNSGPVIPTPDECHVKINPEDWKAIVGHSGGSNHD